MRGRALVAAPKRDGQSQFGSSGCANWRVDLVDFGRHLAPFFLLPAVRVCRGGMRRVSCFRNPFKWNWIAEISLSLDGKLVQND